MATDKRVRVWDRFIRFFHWALVISFAISYFSTVGSQWVHNWSGYAALALVVLRVVWGFVGSTYARFDSFIPGPHRLWDYTRASMKRRAPRHLGHNPAGAVMCLFLFGTIVGIAVSGWMLTLNAFFGSETVENVHVVLVDITLIAVAVHVAGALYESWNHGENLIWSMVTGNKRAPSHEDVTHGPPSPPLPPPEEQSVKRPGPRPIDA